MNDAWTERLKVIKEIVIILAPLITMLLAGAGVKIVSDVHSQQQANTEKLDTAAEAAVDAKKSATEAKKTAEDTRKVMDRTQKTVEATAKEVGAVPPP